MDYDQNLTRIEEELNKALATQRYITQEQLETVIEWKLAAQPGRRDKNIELMNSVPDEFIRLVSKAALLLDDPKIQLKTLSSIPGIGYATATVILAFFDPTNYVVGDRYIVAELLGVDRGIQLTDYPKVLKRLHDENPEGFDLRTVEKAYYWKYREEQDVGRW